MFRNVVSVSCRLQPCRVSLAPDVQVRWRWHKDKLENRTLHRWGYNDNVKQQGPLPRLKNDSDRISQVPVYTPKLSWAEHRALAGQNDYIDILGNEEIHPRDILYNVPKYLRDSHKEEKHVQMAIRRKQFLENTPFPKQYPRKWENWCKQIDRDLKWMNNHVSQKWWANYQGVKTGPVQNPFKPQIF
ncbi:39S ribosomal protein L51, mitochondrial [Eurytemora carolleeae]|uniref:39S ribosomal protein L51, mitochondrial n=1 Tax=Eurytemora carolleeae TaxID=1294199 RepID=UPI000C77BB24|nr:39S ribosomal protein L51, mitochondrial [Eurytemora carolleeae]|eukprot:XP_023339558.1 39S ribosomal protein L51, mitochondrial-like [Eurytemora affinis]